MRERILVVDDEPLIGRGIARLLGREHDVDFVSSVGEAITRLEGASYNVVLSDLLMPGRSGMDLLTEIKQRWPALESRVLFLTGGASSDQSRDFIERMGDKCIMKPFSGDDLRAAIAAVAPAHRSESPA